MHSICANMDTLSASLQPQENSFGEPAKCGNTATPTPSTSHNVLGWYPIYPINLHTVFIASPFQKKTVVFVIVSVRSPIRLSISLLDALVTQQPL